MVVWLEASRTFLLMGGITATIMCAAGVVAGVTLRPPEGDPRRAPSTLLKRLGIVDLVALSMLTCYLALRLPYLPLVSEGTAVYPAWLYAHLMATYTAILVCLCAPALAGAYISLRAARDAIEACDYDDDDDDDDDVVPPG